MYKGTLDRLCAFCLRVDFTNFGRNIPTPAALCRPGSAKSNAHSGRCPGQVTERYPSASAVPGNRIVFRIRGNRYRMVAAIDYQRKELYILFLGTHAEYNRIDATEV